MEQNIERRNGEIFPKKMSTSRKLVDTFSRIFHPLLFGFIKVFVIALEQRQRLDDQILVSFNLMGFADGRSKAHEPTASRYHCFLAKPLFESVPEEGADKRFG